MSKRLLFFYIVLLCLSPGALAQRGGKKQDKSPEVIAQEKLAALQDLSSRHDERKSGQLE